MPYGDETFSGDVCRDQSQRKKSLLTGRTDAASLPFECELTGAGYKMLIDAMDMRTMLQVGALTCLTLAVVMVYYSVARKTYPGFHYWTFGIVSSGAGAVLVSLRNFIPDFWSIIVGNLLIVVMPMLLAHGLSVFLGRGLKILRAVNFTLVALFLLLFLWNTYGSPSLYARVVCVSMIMGIFFCEALYLSIRYVRSVLDEQESILIFFLAFCAAIDVFRLVAVLLGLEKLGFMTLPGILQCLALLGTILGVVGSACSLLILNSHRMENDLKRANSKIQHLANLDGLTNLFNRRYFDSKLEQEFNRIQRSGQPISLILADIDHFKLYNDTYGHQAGDDCLKVIAAAFNACAGRVSDIAARYGGEEFVMLLPNTAEEGAREVAGRLMDKLASLAIPHKSSTVSDQVTMSMGIASLRPDQSVSSETLVLLADKALYQCKSCGKNQIGVVTS